MRRHHQHSPRLKAESLESLQPAEEPPLEIQMRHTYHGGCTGFITSASGSDIDPEVDPEGNDIVFYCDECGEVTAVIDKGVWLQAAEIYHVLTMVVGDLQDMLEEAER